MPLFNDRPGVLLGEAVDQLWWYVIDPSYSTYEPDVRAEWKRLNKPSDTPYWVKAGLWVLFRYLTRRRVEAHGEPVRMVSVLPIEPPIVEWADDDTPWPTIWNLNTELLKLRQAQWEIELRDYGKSNAIATLDPATTEAVSNALEEQLTDVRSRFDTVAEHYGFVLDEQSTDLNQ